MDEINLKNFPQDIATTSNVTKDTKVLIANGVNTYVTTLSAISKLLGVNSEKVESVSPGELPYLDTKNNRYMEVTETGDYYFEGVLLANNPRGYITIFWWDGDSWSLQNQYRVMGDSVENATVNEDGDLIITYTDGVIVNAGHVKGDKGDPLPYSEWSVEDVDKLIQDVNINAQRIPSITAGELPTPPQANMYMVVTDVGAYTYGGATIGTNADGYQTTFWWDGTAWSNNGSVKIKGETPTGSATIVDNEVPSGLAVKDYVEPIFDLTTLGVNLVDTNNFVAGSIANNGTYNVTNNSIRLNYQLVPEEVKGNEITISGRGTIPTGQLLLAVKDDEGVLIQSIAGIGGNDRTNKTITILSNAYEWAFMIANDTSDGGIGTRPNNNPFVTSFMVNLGSVALPFSPYGLMLDEQKLKAPDNIVFTNTVNPTGDGAVPSKEIYKIKESIDYLTENSKNIVDSKNDIRRGYWTNVGVYNNSINWISSIIKPLPNDVLGKLENEELEYIWVSGGGNIPTSGAYLVLFDEADSVIASFAGELTSTFPKRNEIPFNAKKYAITVANDPSDGGIGSRPSDNIYTNSIMVSFGEDLPDYEPYGKIIKKSVLPSDESTYNLNEVIARKINSTTIHLFYHCGGSVNRWFRINLVKSVNPTKFVDVWRLDQGFIVIRSGDVFTTHRRIIQEGVWENAIYTTGMGYSDALGSTHGWESIIGDLSLFMDGNKIDLNTFTEVKGSDLSFFCKSNFLTPDGLNIVGTSFKQWGIKNGLLTHKNSINWLSSITLANIGMDRSYIAMCSVLRADSAGNITHSAVSNEDGTVYDVSEAGFTTPIFSDDKNPRRNSIILWGDEIKVKMDVDRLVRLSNGSILVGGYSDAGAYLKNTISPNYNKEYFLMGGSSVSNGDYWEIEAVYTISNI